jgi:circadian clock protein KaiB
MSQTRDGPATDLRTVPEQQVWELRLYVAGPAPRCLAAHIRLKALCEEHVPGRYHIQVIDLFDQPQRAGEDEIVAIPTVIRALPLPIRRVVGDLADTERTLAGLQLWPHRL